MKAMLSTTTRKLVLFFNTTKQSALPVAIGQGLSDILVTTKVLRSSVKPLSAHARIRPFEEIPGPRCWPLIDTLPSFILKHKTPQLQLLQELKSNFGKLVKLQVPFEQQPRILLYSAEDMRLMFKADSVCPHRQELELVGECRKENNLGISLLNANGSLWRKERDVFVQAIGNAHPDLSYIEHSAASARILCEYLLDNRDHCGQVNNMEDCLKKWSFNCMSLMAFGPGVELIDDERSDRLIEYSRLVMNGMGDLKYSGSLWRCLKYTKIRDFKRNFFKFRGICEEYARTVLTKNVELSNSMAAHMIQNNFSREKLVEVFVTALLASIETTSTSLLFLLHCLATDGANSEQIGGIDHQENGKINLQHQELIRREIFNFLPHLNSPLTTDQLQGMRHLRACMKESMRLYPVSLIHSRCLGENAVLSGYRVPAGTKCLALSGLAGWEEEYFSDAHLFLPERWLRTQNRSLKHSDWAFTPFGHGPRMCIGRRLAELNLRVAVVEILRRFHVTTATPHFRFNAQLIFKPDRQINMIFSDICQNSENV